MPALVTALRWRVSSGGWTGVDTAGGHERERAAGESEGGFFALAEALRAFMAGQLAGEPSDRALAEAAGVSATTVGDWLRGGRFPQDIEQGSGRGADGAGAALPAVSLARPERAGGAAG